MSSHQKNGKKLSIVEGWLEVGHASPFAAMAAMACVCKTHMMREKSFATNAESSHNEGEKLMKTEIFPALASLHSKIYGLLILISTRWRCRVGIEREREFRTHFKTNFNCSSTHSRIDQYFHFHSNNFHYHFSLISRGEFGSDKRREVKDNRRGHKLLFILQRDNWNIQQQQQIQLVISIFLIIHYAKFRPDDNKNIIN